MDGDARINPYLSGNFAPVRSEDDFELTVIGEIPKRLRGTLYRTGPSCRRPTTPMPRRPRRRWMIIGRCCGRCS